MNAREATALVAMIPGLFPATAKTIDTQAANQWAALLCDPAIPFDIARLALLSVVRRQRFIHPSEIVSAVKQMRKIASNSVEHLVPKGDPPLDAKAFLDHLHEHQRQVLDLADQAIRDGALDFSDVNLTDASEDMGEPTELPVSVARLTVLPPAAPRPELLPADPGRMRRMVKAATPTPERRAPKVPRDPSIELSEAELAERAAEQQRQQEALQKLIEGAA